MRFISETHVLAQSEPTDGSRHGSWATQLQVTLSGNVSWHESHPGPSPHFPTRPGTACCIPWEQARRGGRGLDSRQGLSGEI